MARLDIGGVSLAWLLDGTHGGDLSYSGISERVCG